MDIASVFGMGASVFMIILSLVLGGQALSLYIDIPSVLLVLFGSLGSTVLTVDISVIKALPTIMKKIWNKDRFNEQEIIAQLVGFSESARKDGLLSLDDSVKDVEDPFLAIGLRLMVDGTDPIIIKRILELELEKIEERHAIGINFFINWGTLGPAYGMLGTVMGLIGMMANMADTSSIGKGMALALITTLYGSLLANVFANPCGTKLGVRHDQEMNVKSVMMEGILSIQGGENPRLLEQKLYSFLPPKDRPASKDFE